MRLAYSVSVRQARRQDKIKLQILSIRNLYSKCDFGRKSEAVLRNLEVEEIQPRDKEAGSTGLETGRSAGYTSFRPHARRDA